MRYLLIAVAAALALSGCGAYHMGAGSTATPSEGPGLGFDVVVTEKDRAATLRVGQKLEVVLHAGDRMDRWQQVRSSNENVLVPIVNPAATAMQGVTLAAFKAVAPGEATISAYASPKCPAGTACPMYVQVWSLKVTVTA